MLQHPPKIRRRRGSQVGDAVRRRQMTEGDVDDEVVGGGRRRAVEVGVDMLGVCWGWREGEERKEEGKGSVGLESAEVVAGRRNWTGASERAFAFLVRLSTLSHLSILPHQPSPHHQPQNAWLPAAAPRAPQ